MLKSFFLAGFECSTGYNRHRQWIDQIEATQHDRYVLEDYRLIREHGMRAAREGVRWPLVDRGGRYDFSSIDPFLEAGRETEIDLVWDLFHFGYPEEVDLFSSELPKRFADYCFAAARYIGERTEGTCWFTPVNEPSYFAWAGGEVGLFAPHAHHRGAELKRNLIRAAIQGIDAIWQARPDARIINADPVCRVVASNRRPESRREADHFNEQIVFESYDMLSGKTFPELGGSRRHLDVAGINYYANNQWVLSRPGVPLRPDDPRRVPLRTLVMNVYERYGGELMITETSDSGDRRAGWLREVAGEVEALLEAGVPLRGVCIYPILGMPEWHDRNQWARMGLWDLVPRSPSLGRELHQPMAHALLEAQRRLGEPWWVWEGGQPGDTPGLSNR